MYVETYNVVWVLLENLEEEMAEASESDNKLVSLYYLVSIIY